MQHWTLQGKKNLILGKEIEYKNKYIQKCFDEKMNEKVPATHFSL